MKRKRNIFTKTKMLSSRIELSDFIKFEQKLNLKNQTLQEWLNLVVVNCISGTLSGSGL